ncbi:unnamed protein product [Prorocentrum cordatum]|uniref:Uncharacterized protein n=1 Tax=Prorocentrum cordatum TaxID=2364126 RepID=A0ABN9XZH0_9DINO|nr:unnamed protein product [Polarella glacialis]
MAAKDAEAADEAKAGEPLRTRRQVCSAEKDATSVHERLALLHNRLHDLRKRLQKFAKQQAELAKHAEDKKKLQTATTKIRYLERRANQLAAAGQPAVAGAGKDWNLAVQHLTAAVDTPKKVHGEAAARAPRLGKGKQALAHVEQKRQDGRDRARHMPFQRSQRDRDKAAECSSDGERLTVSLKCWLGRAKVQASHAKLIHPDFGIFPGDCPWLAVKGTMLSCGQAIRTVAACQSCIEYYAEEAKIADALGKDAPGKSTLAWRKWVQEHSDGGGGPLHKWTMSSTPWQPLAPKNAGKNKLRITVHSHVTAERVYWVTRIVIHMLHR